MNTTMFQVAWLALSPLYPNVSVSAKIPLAQAVHESANFTSHVFDVANNCFGMMAPAARNTTCTNKGKGGYANYSSVLDCLRDYYLWCEAMGIKSDGDLDAFIKAGRYAADPKYYQKVAAQMADLKKAGKYIAPAALAAAGLVGIPAAGWVMVQAVSAIVDELS